MNVSVEKLITLLAIAAFIATSANSLSALGEPITKEEAIEISKNSELVKEGLTIAYSFVIEAKYYNSSMLEQLKKWHSDEIFENVPKDAFWEEKMPEGHSAWEVIWWFKYNKPGGYNVIVVVDAETGTIVHEAKGIELH